MRCNRLFGFPAKAVVGGLLHARRQLPACGLGRGLLVAVLCGWSMLVLSQTPAEAPAPGSIRYVIDKLLVGLYDRPADGAERLGLYPSGTRLEVIAGGETFTRVRAPDGEEGFIRTVYLAPDPTAAQQLAQTKAEIEELAAQRTALATRLEEAETKLAQATDQREKSEAELARLEAARSALSAQVERLNAELSENRALAAEQTAQMTRNGAGTGQAAGAGANGQAGKASETSRSEADAPTSGNQGPANAMAATGAGAANEALERENTELKSRIAGLRLNVSELEEKIAEFERRSLDRDARAELDLANQELASLRAELRAAKERGRDGSAVGARGGPALWVTLTVGLLGLLGGGFGGIYLTDYMHRRRHGGFRV